MLRPFRPIAVACVLAGLVAALLLGLRPTPPARAATGFAFTGSLATPRADHTATPLLDGKVLIVGGLNGEAPVARAELW